MNYEERIPLNSLLSGQRTSQESHGHSSRINSRPLPLPVEGSSEILEHLISVVLQGNVGYLDKLLKNDEVLDAIDMQDNKGFTPLHIAADKFDADCCRLLLQAGADPNIPDRYKRTALHWVVNGGCRCDTCNTRKATCVDLLIAANVNLEVEDYEGETALHYAARNALHKPASVMLQNGAEISRSANGVNLGHLIVQKIPEVMTQLMDGSITYDDHDNSKLKLDFGVLIDAGRKNDSLGIEEYSVRDVNGKPRKETDLLGYMMRAHPTGKEALLTHPLTEAFLHLKWQYVRKWFWFTRFFYCMLSLVYTYFVFNFYIFTCPYYKTWATTPNSSPEDKEFKCEQKSFELYILAVCIGGGVFFMLLNQLYKLCSNPYDYLKSGLNFGWWILIACVCLTILPPLPLGVDLMEWQYPVAAFGVFYAWSMNLVHLNHLPYFGVYIEMLWKVLQKLAIVSATFASLFIAFALGFCLLFPEVGFFDGIHKSIIKSVIMMLGDRDYPVIFNEDNERLSTPQYAIPAHLFYFAFLFIFGIVLMNLLMGLAVSDVQILQRNAELSRVCRQITEITVLESFAASKCLSSCFTRCILSRISVRTRNGRYFSISPTDPDDRSLPCEIKTKLIPYTKSRPCLNQNKIRRPFLGSSQRFSGQNGIAGRNVQHFQTQDTLDDILNDLRNKLRSLGAQAQPNYQMLRR